MNRFFTEMYAKHLGKTVFFLAIGVSSSVGNYFMIKQFLNNDLYANIVSISWAILLVTIYSDILAKREYQYRILADSFNYHRTLRPDNLIGAVVPGIAKTNEEPTSETVIEEEENTNKSEITKIEFIHSMEPMTKNKG